MMIKIILLNLNFYYFVMNWIFHYIKFYHIFHKYLIILIYLELSHKNIKSFFTDVNYYVNKCYNANNIINEYGLETEFNYFYQELTNLYKDFCEEDKSDDRKIKLLNNVDKTYQRIYSIDGCQQTALRQGLNIVQRQMADGTVRTIKTLYQ